MDEERQRLADEAWLDAALGEELGGELVQERTGSARQPAQPPSSFGGARGRGLLAAALWLSFGLAVVGGIAFSALGSGPSVEARQDPERPPTRADGPAPEPLDLRVLHVTGVPHWNYRYLKNHLRRSELVEEMASWVDDASLEFEQEHRGREPLREAPMVSGDLGGFDVVLIDDLAVARWGADDAARQDFAERLARFAAEGGGLWIRCDRNLTLEQVAAFPELRALLPVLPVAGADPEEGDSRGGESGEDEGAPAAGGPVPAGRTLAAVRVAVDRWHDPQGRWRMPTLRGRPTRDAVPVLTVGEPQVLVVARRAHGSGQVVLTALSSWRLRGSSGGSAAEGEALHADWHDLQLRWLGGGTSRR